MREYARRVLEFLEGTRKEKMRKEKEERAKIKWNMSAGVFRPREEKEEKKNHERMEEGGESISTPRRDRQLIRFLQNL